MTRVQIKHHSGPKFYPVIDTPAGLGWLGQVAALELHVPQWRIQPGAGPTAAASTTGATRFPDRVVFDLDPGPGAGLPECVEVALYLRERLGPLGARLVPVTSGSKGLHVYVPMDTGAITSDQAVDWARLVAEQIEKAMPTLVVSKMAKSLRPGKVLIDWSQNHPRKTTVAPYSLRGRTHPTVAAPRTWDELAEPDLHHLDYREVLERVAAGLDPLAALMTPDVQVLPAAAGAPVPPARSRITAGRPAKLKVAAPTRPARRQPPAQSSRVLPPGLAGPVDVELARAGEKVPGSHALPGGSCYELKWDGYRGALVRDHTDARLWSRQGKDLSAQFPEIIAAAAALPAGTVLDGEIVIWNGARLDFDLLQRRLAGGTAKIAAQAREHPASYVAFDLLAHTGQDLRPEAFADRRDQLETLAGQWRPPLHLSPMTRDRDEALQWMADYRPAGLEGLVVKGASSPYEPGQRRWIKHKTRESTEVIIGAVTGPITVPQSIIAGLYRDGQLRIVGRSVALKPAQSRSLAEVLTAAGPDHPWPDSIIANRFGNSRDRTVLTKVQPQVVAEVTADTGLQGGVWRHPLRFVRHRPDLHVDDLPSVDRTTEQVGRQFRYPDVIGAGRSTDLASSLGRVGHFMVLE